MRLPRPSAVPLTCCLAVRFTCGSPEDTTTHGHPDIGGSTGQSSEESAATDTDLTADNSTTSANTGDDPTTTDDSDDADGVTASDHLRLCIEGPGIDHDLPDDGTTTYVVKGTVSAVGSFHDASSYCAQLSLTHSLRVTDDDGATWRIDYELVDEDDGTQLLPRLPLELHQQVRLELGIVWYAEFGATASAVIVSDQAGLVAFLEQGSWGFALGPTAWPGLAITRGAETGTRLGECGHEIHYEHRFAGEQALSVAPGEAAPFVLAGQSMVARNVSNFVLDSTGECSDFVPPIAWALWRDGRIGRLRAGRR